MILKKRLTVQKQKHPTLGEFGKVVLVSKKLAPYVGKSLRMKIEIEILDVNPPIYSTEE